MVARIRPEFQLHATRNCPLLVTVTKTLASHINNLRHKHNHTLGHTKNHKNDLLNLKRTYLTPSCVCVCVCARVHVVHV